MKNYNLSISGSTPCPYRAQRRTFPGTFQTEVMLNEQLAVVLMAEIVNFLIPKVVDMHNYPSTSSIVQKE